MNRAAVRGWACAIAAVVCWGVMFPVGDLQMKSGTLRAAEVAMYRYLLAAPLLLAAAAVSRGLRGMFPRGAATWARLAGLGLVGSAAMALLLFRAQELVPPVNASLMEAYVPMQVAALGLLFGRRTGWRQAAGIALGFLGSLFVLRALDGTGLRLAALSRGDAYTFLSGLCWAAYTAWGRRDANALGGVVFSAWTVLFGGFWLLLWMVASGAPPSLPANAVDFGCLAFLAVFPTCIAFFGWNEAHRTMSLPHLSFLEYVPPLVAAVAGVLFFGQAMTPWQWLGLAVVLLAARVQA